jgi:hypothetical protein
MVTTRGGLEMLFDNKRRHSISLPATDSSGKPANIAFLIDHLCRNLMKDPRAELFVLDNHMYVLSLHPLVSLSVESNLADAPASWSSSTTPIGNSKGKRPMRSSRATTFCLSRPCTEANQKPNPEPRGKCWNLQRKIADGTTRFQLIQLI